MEPHERRWWSALERLRDRVTTVQVWHGSDRPTRDWEYHPSPTLVASLAGVVRVVSPRRRIDLGVGEVLILDAGVMHRHVPLRPGAVLFGQGFMAAWSDVWFDDGRHRWYGRMPTQPIRGWFDELVTDPAHARRRALVSDVLGRVLNESIKRLDLTSPAVSRMIEVLWRGLHEGVTSAEVMRASGLSPRQAWTVFRNAYGATPRQAICAGRLWMAERLLQEGLRIAEVAARCGWSSADAFSRAWKQAHGSPPSRYQS